MVCHTDKRGTKEKIKEERDIFRIFKKLWKSKSEPRRWKNKNRRRGKRGRQRQT
jgi:hypothetical protein